MKQDTKPATNNLDAGNNAEQQLTEAEREQMSDAAEQQKNPVSQVDKILTALGVSENIQASAKAILEPIEKGVAPGESIVRLVVNALRHDEDVKNAEAEGYLRGRNEVIDAASKACDQQGPQPLNFPIYRKSSFWD